MPRTKVKPDAKSAMKVKLDCLRLAHRLAPKEATSEVLKLACGLYHWVRDDRSRARRKFLQAVTSKDMDRGIKSIAAMDDAAVKRALGRIKQAIAAREGRDPDAPPAKTDQRSA